MPSMTEGTQPVKVLDGKKLRRLRIIAGLTQDLLAERAGCTQVHIASLENNRRGASPPMLLNLSRALGCHPTDLMPDEADGNAA